MNFLKLTTAIASLTVLLTCMTTAQSIKERCDAMRLQPDKPHAVISLDHIELKESPNGKPYREVWFRLHNNTGCKIVISTADDPVAIARTLKDEKGIPLKNQTGGWQFEYTTDLIDNSLNMVDAFVFSPTRPRKRYGIGEGFGDVRFLRALRSGESVLFRTHENNLKKGRIVSVEYAYEGEEWQRDYAATFNYGQSLKEAINNLKNLKTQNETN